MKKARIIAVCMLCAISCMVMSSCGANGGADASQSGDNSAESSAAQVSGTTKDGPWREVYEKQLGDFYKENPKLYSVDEKMYYDICDLNGDEIPELIISEGTAHVCACRLYTYKDGRLVDIGRYGEWGVIKCYPESHLIIHTAGGMGHSMSKWYELEGAEMKLLFSTDKWIRYDEENSYSFNSKTVTEEQLESLEKKYADSRPADDEEMLTLGRTCIRMPDKEAEASKP